MSHVQEAAQSDPPGKDEIEATDERGRRWYHPRPQPRHRMDIMGFNKIWWALFWVIVIVLAVLPYPWWW